MATGKHLSGSTDGLPIKITATSGGGSGNTIHTSVSGTTQVDSVTLFCHNNHTAPVELNLELGGTTADELTQVTIPQGSGRVKVLSNFIINNSKVITAYATTTANVLFVSGVAITATTGETT